MVNSNELIVSKRYATAFFNLNSEKLSLTEVEKNKKNWATFFLTII